MARHSSRAYRSLSPIDVNVTPGTLRRNLNLHKRCGAATYRLRLFSIMERPAMDDPRETPGMPGTNDALKSILTEVQKMNFPEGTGFGFSLLDEETKTPCFRLVFETTEDAEQGRSMMQEIIEHCLWYEVPEA